MPNKKIPKIKLYLNNIQLYFNFKAYWWIYLATLIASIIGIVIGILVARDTNCDNFFDLYGLLKSGEYNYFSSFFKFSLYLLPLSIFALISIINPAFSAITGVLAMYFGYKIGFDIMSSTSQSPSTATLTIILFWLPYMLVATALSSTIIVYNLTFNHCLGCINPCPKLVKNSAKMSLFLYVLATILVLVITIILPFAWNLLFY